MGILPIPGAGGGFPGIPGGPGGPGFPFPGGPGVPGFPGGGPGGFPGSPGGAPGGVQAPTAPPPQFVPQMQATTFAVDPGGIRRCLFRNTYIWLNNGEQFWFYPVFVGRNSIAGFRWNGLFWGYFGIDLSRISSFTCF
ncbi:collagen-like protein [Paenibacillus tritici]|uniref:Collagen-like protein n=2 Tax=Paenibacillus tritici TaxID=1873425 RepID=A0ABX2DQ35_9BACL|nr:collagen-like protein [Paenibacillus tritici]NQX46540.1 collagen-like protein [Paenibacillus tritici]